MSKRLEGKQALITAAGQGIGRATAIAFHNEGAKVYATDINDKTLKTLKEEYSEIEIYNLEKNLSLLATISGAAPMMGFLGTVTGMIQAFISIAQEEGAVSPKLLSSGIYEAMITTAAGLFVGIVAYLAYNYLFSKIKKLIHRMKYSTIEFIETLQSKR